MFNEHIANAGPLLNLGGELWRDVAKIIIDVIPCLVTLNYEATEIFIEDIADNTNREVGFTVKK